MWQTPDALRALEGAERALLFEGVLGLRAMLLEQDPDSVLDSATNVDLFEELTNGEKLFALAFVSSSLIDQTEPPNPTAWADATIYAIYQNILLSIVAEIDEGNPRGMSRCHHRQLVADVLPNVKVKSRNLIYWNEKIEECVDLILWDRDFEQQNLFLDSPPDVAKVMKDQLGIDKDYFVTPIPSLTPSDIVAADALIRLLAGHPAATGVQS